MFKKSKVVMLPTNEKANNKYFSNELLLCVNKETKNVLKFGNNSPFDILGGYFKPQHLYFLSDEEIKEGDWFVGFADGSISPFVGQADKSTVEINNWQLNKKGTSSNKKIIATTDTLSILVNDGYLAKESPTGTVVNYLPQPSQSFLEKFVEEYNKGNVITEVLVEYESIGAYANPKYDSDYQLKVNPKDNTITIRKMKDSWSRDEVVKLINSFYDHTYGGISYETKDKWIEENL